MLVFVAARSASELSRDSPPNSLPPRSSRLSSSASRATHCQPAFLLSASVDSSDNRLGCLACTPPSVSASGSALRHALPCLPHSLFLTQSHSPLHHRVNPNSITNTLYHSHTFIGPHSSENGEVTSNAILNRGKSIDRFSLLFFTLFLHTHTLFRSLLLPFSISFLPLSHSILIFAKAMISQCNPSSAHSIYSMLCVTVHSIHSHSLFLHSNSLPIPTLSLSPWNGCGI